MPFYVADYLADTGHLSAAEHGGYLLLIMHYWQNGGLPTEDRRLARIARMSTAEWGESRDVLADLFAEGWVHKRIDAELKAAAEVSEKARAKAVRRWQGQAADAGADAAADAGDDAAPDAGAMPGQVPQPCQSQSQSQSQLQSELETLAGSLAPAPRQSPPVSPGPGRARAPAEHREIDAALRRVLSEERAAAVIAHRRSLKKPLTLHAARLLASQLALAAEPDRAADLMIVRGWQGFAPEWGVNAGLVLATPPVQPEGDAAPGVRISPIDDPEAWDAWRQARGGKPLPTDKTGWWTVPTRLPPTTTQHEREQAA
ncbi:primosomal protein I [Bosea sp. BIWAKO-01]|nr:primosomal protein I [Bosea sp. BIWAKO-01]